MLSSHHYFRGLGTLWQTHFLDKESQNSECLPTPSLRTFIPPGGKSLVILGIYSWSVWFPLPNQKCTYPGRVPVQSSPRKHPSPNHSTLLPLGAKSPVYPYPQGYFISQATQGHVCTGRNSLEEKSWLQTHSYWAWLDAICKQWLINPELQIR